VFGEEASKGTIVRATGQTTGQDSGGLGSSFDYILVYARDPESEVAGLPLSEHDLDRYEESDARGQYALWQLRKTGKNDRRSDRPNMYFPVENPDGQLVLPTGPTGYESCWRFDPKGYARLVADDMIVWKRRQSPSTGFEEWWPYVKTYLEGRTKRPSPLWIDIEGSKKASRDLRALLGDNIFNNPKPVPLIERAIQIAPEGGDEPELILDFFAGAGATAQAVLELSREDNRKRSFILVQLPEPTGRQDYKTIADITKERVRRVIKNLNEEDAGKLDLNGHKQNRGFRVFKLAESNFKTWNADAPKNADGIAEQLELHADHVRPGRSQDDLLFEILLKSGYPLTTKVEAFTVEGKQVFSAADGALLVCLEKALTLEAIRAIAARMPERVVCLDEAFRGNDQLKANAVQIFRSLHRRSGEGETSSDVTVFRTV
jgi:adenine-specific DNA-methyltransferase